MEKVARIVLHLHSAKESKRAFRGWETHLARALWMTTHGYKYLLACGSLHEFGDIARSQITRNTTA
ncbi:MAG: hypothetical protein EOR05_33960 [Mesorhizobium sp.]|nr:MAG: hypothetical protein EOR05_33960 [Mesorhizobium sp.]